MLKSEEKHQKTKVKINPKKKRTKSSYYPLSQFYENSIVLTDVQSVPFNPGFIVGAAHPTKP